MIESLEIKNFRCFRDLKMSSFERVNLIAGVNNVGKTALLEAMYLLAAPSLPVWPPSLNFQRGFDKLPISVDLQTRWGWLFHGRLLGDPIELEWKATGDRTRQIKIRWHPATEAPVRFDASAAGAEANTGPGLVILEFHGSDEGDYQLAVSSNGFTRPESKAPSVPVGVISGAREGIPGTRESILELDATRLSEVYVAGASRNVLSGLQVIEPRLSDLKVLYLSGVPMVYGDIGIGRPVPLAQMGEGVGRVLSIVLEIARAAGGVVLIDEVEHGIHHSAMAEIWKSIAEESRRSDTQIFATTHSWECIQAAHMAFEQSTPYDLRLYRLERAEGEIRAIQYDRETLGTSVEMNLEVR
jgi:hypothetical protein